MLDLKPELIQRLDTQARDAIALWGENAQFNMVIEETSELLNEVSKIHRNRQNWDNILEEAVDTYIMMTEIFIMYGPERVNEMLEKKLTKFKGNIDRSRAKRSGVYEENIKKFVPTHEIDGSNVVVLFSDANNYSGA